MEKAFELFGSREDFIRIHREIQPGEGCGREEAEHLLILESFLLARIAKSEALQAYLPDSLAPPAHPAQYERAGQVAGVAILQSYMLKEKEVTQFGDALRRKRRLALKAWDKMFACLESFLLARIAKSEPLPVYLPDSLAAPTGAGVSILQSTMGDSPC